MSSMPIKLFPIDVDQRRILPPEARVLPWVAAGGDATLRIHYPLNNRSLVYDIGGYRGDWAKEIDALYGCTIKIFEPVNDYIKILTDMFGKKPSIEILPFGLGGRAREMFIGIDWEASSVFKPGTNKERIKIRDIAKFMGDEKVDLMKMNIEGGEYEILDRLIETGLIKNVKNVQIQFHDFVPDAKAKRQRLQKILSATHSLTYHYPFIWENWERND